MDDDDLGMRIVDRQMRKGQTEVTGEAPCVTTNLDVEDGKRQLEKRRLEAKASRDSARARLSWSYLAWRISRSR